MISIIQRRKRLLAAPFTTDRTGSQLCCTVVIVSLLAPAITVLPLISAKTSAYQVTHLPDNQNWLDCDITFGTELNAMASIVSEMSCTAGSNSQLYATVNQSAVFECLTSVVTKLSTAIKITQQMNCQVSAVEQINTSVVVVPKVSASITRPEC